MPISSRRKPINIFWVWTSMITDYICFILISLSVSLSVYTVLQFYFILAVRFEGNSAGWVIDDHCHFPQFVTYIVITRLKGI